MGAIWMWGRSVLRTRWRSWVTLIVLTALIGGVAIAAIAGGRRTASAHRRLIAATNTPEAFLPVFPWLGIREGIAKDLEALSEVREVVRFAAFSSSGENGISILAPKDEAAARSMVPKVIEGRLPDQTRANEIVIPFSAVEEIGAGVGETLSVRLASERRPRVVLELLVVGVSVLPLDFPSGGPGGLTSPGPVATTAFAAAHGSRAEFTMLGVHLVAGSGGTAALERNLEERLGEQAFLLMMSTAEHAVNVERSNRLQSAALWAFAAVLALSGLMTMAQIVARNAILEADEHPVLRALGLTGGQLFGVALAHAAIVAAVGAMAAVATAIALSPLTPLGLARLAEPDPGLSIDSVTLIIGAGVLIVVVLAAAAIPAARVATARARAAERARPSALGELAARAGAGPSAVAGIRLAVDRGRGTSAVPVRATLAGVMLGIATLVMALGFGSSLTHLIQTRALHGDVIDASFFVDRGAEQYVERLRADPRIEAFSIGSGGPTQVDDLTVGGMWQKGTLALTILQGRAPGGAAVDDEIVLGTETLRALGKTIGDRVRVSIPGLSGDYTATIVGRAVFPPISDALGFGRGAWISYARFSELIPEAVDPNEVAMRFVPGTDHAAAIAEYEAVFESSGGEEISSVPGQVLNFGRVENLPLLLAGTLALLAALTLAHLLLSSISRRRRDLAILKTLGFARRDVRRTVSWQAGVLTIAGVAIGVPLGIVAGRWLWELFASRLGVLSEPVTPALPVVSVVPLALVVALVIAQLPARAAARTKPAIVLRSE